MKLLVSASLALIAFAAWAKPPTVNELILGKDFNTPTCSVDKSATSRDQKTWFAVPHDAPALMKMDGKKVELSLVPGQASLWSFQKQNQVVSTKYQSGDVTVELNGRVSDVCEKNEQGCEHTDLVFEKMIITKGTDIIIMTKLTGGCGV